MAHELFFIGFFYLYTMKDDIYNSVPVNKMAAVVTSQTEVVYNPKFTTKTIRSSTPLPTENIQVSKNEYGIIGKRFGSFIVIGAYPLYNRRRNRQWVVKCDCGMYETRRLKSLRTATKEGLCCMDCQCVKKLSQRSEPYSEDERGITLKEQDNEGYFKTKNNSFKRSFNKFDIAINQNDEEDFIVDISNRRIKFGFNKFKIGDIITKKN